VTVDEAKELLNSFWISFPRIKAFLDKVVKEGIAAKKAVAVLDHRSRDLSSINFMIPKSKSHAQSILKNHNFQAGNASMTKRALCMLQDGFFEHPEWDAKILTTIHDEILTTQNKVYDAEVLEFVVDAMVKAGEHYIKTIPVLVDAVSGSHWIH